MEYDDSLLGNRPQLSLYYFNNGTNVNSKLALKLIKYAIETRLKWYPF